MRHSPQVPGLAPISGAGVQRTSRLTPCWSYHRTRDRCRAALAVCQVSASDEESPLLPRDTVSLPALVSSGGDRLMGPPPAGRDCADPLLGEMQAARRGALPYAGGSRNDRVPPARRRVTAGAGPRSGPADARRAGEHRSAPAGIDLKSTTRCVLGVWPNSLLPRSTISPASVSGDLPRLAPITSRMSSQHHSGTTP